jgi:hypothetical protein
LLEADEIIVKPFEVGRLGDRSRLKGKEFLLSVAP